MLTKCKINTKYVTSLTWDTEHFYKLTVVKFYQLISVQSLTLKEKGYTQLKGNLI